MSTRIIKINRGDSFEMDVKIPDKADPTKSYFLTARDALYFALTYPNQRFENAIFVQGYTFEEQKVSKEVWGIFEKEADNSTRLADVEDVLADLIGGVDID